MAICTHHISLFDTVTASQHTWSVTLPLPPFCLFAFILKHFITTVFNVNATVVANVTDIFKTFQITHTAVIEAEGKLQNVPFVTWMGVCTTTPPMISVL